MAMDIHSLKQRLQNHFKDGLVTIIGSGLSSAEGLPNMNELAQFLRIEIPSCVKNKDLAVWGKIVLLLDQGNNIEEAMIKVPPTSDLEVQIVRIIAEFLLQAEKETREFRQSLEATERNLQARDLLAESL